MPIVSISEAARLAGISRSTLYRVYIRSGKISTVENDRGQPGIDTSELARVFKVLPGVATDATESDSMLHVQEQSDTVAKDAEVAHLRELIAVREEELARALEEIRWLRGKVDALEQKQLAGPGIKRRWWWPW